MNCSDTTEFFSDYYDGGLAPVERHQLEEHLRACPACTSEYRDFTQSLAALHETRPMETTGVFMNNLRVAATQQVDRKQNYPRTKSESVTVVTPKADSKPVGKADRGDSKPVPRPRAGVPGWVPWALAATTLVAFGLGFWVAEPRGNPELEQKVVAQLEELQELKKHPVVPAPAPLDEKKVLQANGLVETVDGQWIPLKWAKDFEQKRVCVGGEMMSREQAAKLLAREFPVEPPAPPPAAAPVPSSDEILERAGYTRVNDVAVPKAWVEKWAEGFVQVGVGEWRKLSDFEDELIREHNLVKLRGKLMTREQADAIQAEQLVKPPAGATASNDFTRALDGLQIGPPMNFNGLTVYPLLAAAAPPEIPIATLHAALGTDKLEITDTLGLFQVQVKNAGDDDVILFCGDLLSGARCSRVVSEDTLVPRGQTVRVSVLCVEPGGWKVPAERFTKESGHFVAPPSIRRSLIWEQGQGAVWSLLARRLGGRSGLVDLYRKQADAIAEVRAYFSALPDRETTAVGLAVATGDAVEFVEVFPDHALFSAYFERLIAGAALDVLEKLDPGSRVPSTFPNTMKGVKQLLESAFSSLYDARDDGFTVRREETVVGRVRLSGGTLQHALLFGAGAPEWERKTAYAVPKDKVKRILEEYESRMKTLGPAHRALAIHELAAINAPEVVLALIRRLGETDSAVRRAVVQELGASGDPHATDALLLLLPRSAAEPTVYSEIVRSLVRLGHERSVDVLLKQLDGGESELTQVTLQGVADLVLQLRSREAIERAMTRLVALFEASEGVSRGDLSVNDPVVKNMRAADAGAVAELLRTAFKRLVGIEFGSAAGARKFWNDREARERFLQGRTKS